MRVVYKYPLDLLSAPGGQIGVLMPTVRQDLTLQLQNDNICLWSLVDPDSVPEIRVFQVVGTGWELPNEVGDVNYIGTVQKNRFVWHVFEIAREDT